MLLPAELAGARVTRVDRPLSGILALTVRRSGHQHVLLFGFERGALGVGLVAQRPRGMAADAFVQKLRKEIGGACLGDMTAPLPGSLCLELRHKRGTRVLVLDLGRPLVALVDSEGELLVASDREVARGPYAPQGGRPRPVPSTLDGWYQEGRRLVDQHATSELRHRKQRLSQALKRSKKRVDRKLDAIRQDAERAQEGPTLRRDADFLLSNLHRLSDGQTDVVATDWSSDPPASRPLPIDPALGAKATAERLYHRARRLERGGRIAAERLERTEAERAELARLLAELEEADCLSEVEALAARAIRAGARGLRATPDRGTTKSKQSQRRRPFRRFLASGGASVLVGRGAADNDALTVRQARPHDLWLHAREGAGAHVIVQLERGQPCPPEVLVDAATLAAHFSAFRGEPVVDVQYVQRRFVRKPKGFPPGAVAVEREKVLMLRMEPDRLERLLKSEA
jgi:hypothetical protein